MEATNTSLLRRVRDPSDHASWAEFVALYEPILFAYVRKHNLDHNDARDLVQNIFISLLRKLPQFELDRSKGRFRTWLWRVSSNAVVDWDRGRQRVRKVEATRRSQKPEAALENPDPEWESMYRQRVLKFALEQVRGKTIPRTWACFEEHLLKGRPGGLVGAELGLPANTVYKNAGRVLKDVKAQCLAYEEELGDEPDLLSP